MRPVRCGDSELCMCPISWEIVSFQIGLTCPANWSQSVVLVRVIRWRNRFSVLLPEILLYGHGTIAQPAAQGHLMLSTFFQKLSRIVSSCSCTAIVSLYQPAPVTPLALAVPIGVIEVFSLLRTRKAETLTSHILTSGWGCITLVGCLLKTTWVFALRRHCMI
jgi:hypothetical protein